MSDMELQKIELTMFMNFLLGSPKRLSAAAGMVLNDAARDTQKFAKREIKSEMTVRSKFALGRVQYTKSKFKGPVRNLFSLVGSKEAPRFTGWKEQELGTETDRHVATIAARGAKAKPIRRPARLGKPYFHPARFPFRGRIAARMRRGGARWEVPAMTGVLRRMGYRKPFIITGHPTIPPGLYKLRGGRKRPTEGKSIELLQSFDPRKQQPARIKWLSTSVRRYWASGNFRRSWVKAARRTFARRRYR